MSISEEKLKLDFFKWLITDTITNKYINDRIIEINTDQSQLLKLCNIEIVLKGFISGGTTPSPSLQNTVGCYPNVVCPEVPCCEKFLHANIQITNINSINGSSFIDISNSKRITPKVNQTISLRSGPIPTSSNYPPTTAPIAPPIILLPLYWTNASIGLPQNTIPQGIKYNGNEAIRCSTDDGKIPNFWLFNSLGTQVPGPDLFFDLKGKEPFKSFCRVGPCILSADGAQYTFAYDSKGKLYLVGNIFPDPLEAQNLVLYGSQGGDWSEKRFLCFPQLSTFPPAEGNGKIYFDFYIDFTAEIQNSVIFRQLFNLFVETNPTYLQSFCLNNQNIDTFWQSQCNPNKGIKYYRNYIDDKPSGTDVSGCDTYIPNWCKGVGKIVDPSFCGCYLDPPEKIKEILTNNDNISLCDPTDIDTDGCIPPECILPSCMNGNAYKTRRQMEQICGSLASIGYNSNSSDINYKNSELSVKFGDEGGATLKLDVKENFTYNPNKNSLSKGAIIAIIILSIIFFLFLIVLCVILCNKKK